MSAAIAICLSLANMSAAVVEAREAGVPLAIAVQVLDTMPVDGFSYRFTYRVIVEAYTQPRTDEPFDRDEYVNIVAARCMFNIAQEK